MTRRTHACVLRRYMEFAFGSEGMGWGGMATFLLLLQLQLLQCYYFYRLVQRQ